MFIWLESRETHFSSILLICIEFISLLKHSSNSLQGEVEGGAGRKENQVAICHHRVS